MKVKDFHDKSWVAGLKAGLKVASDIAKKQGYELYFPDIDEMEIEKE